MKRLSIGLSPLSQKILLLMSLMTILLSISLAMLQNSVLERSYRELEEDMSLKNLSRTRQAIERELGYVDSFVLDWSYWDDTYDFALSGGEEYVNSNLGIDSFYNISIDLIYIFDSEGQLIRGELYDYEKWEKLPSENFASQYLTEILRENQSDEDPVVGMLNTYLGPVIISARPILRSDGSGPSAGTLLMGRIVNDAFLEKIREITQSTFLLHIDGRDTIIEKLRFSADAHLIETDRDNIYIYTALEDLSGSPAFVLESVTDRSVSRFGIGAVKILQRLVIAVSISATVIILAALRILIIHPLRKITRYLETWSRDKGSPVNIETKRKDEIGTLSRGIISYTKELETLASTDSLTGLNNRHIMDTIIPRFWKLLSRDHSNITVILLDIDHFKRYNDTYGHQKGDECLRKVSEILKKCIYRSTDMVIRYGGEEFLVILPATTSDGGKKVAHKIQESLSEARIEHNSSDASSYVTFSIGMASMVPDPENNLDQLIEMADKALYQSKEDGRNRITVHKI